MVLLWHMLTSFLLMLGTSNVPAIPFSFSYLPPAQNGRFWWATLQRKLLSVTTDLHSFSGVPSSTPPFFVDFILTDEESYGLRY